MTSGKVHLGEVCEFVYGESLKDERRNPGKVPVFGSNGVVGWHDRAITTGPTIIIGRKGSFGEVNWSDNPCFPIDTTYYIQKTKRPCDLRWLYFTLLKLDLTRLNKSAAVPGLNRDDAYRELIPFPEVSEQEEIAEQLNKADRLRRTRRYALELSDTFLQSVFLEMFGDPMTNFRQWETVPFGNLIVRGPQNGIYKPASAYGQGTRILRIDAFYDGVVKDLRKLKRVRLSESEVDLYALREKEIVINRVNSPSHLGKSALIPSLDEPTVFESNMMRLGVNTARVDPVYLIQFLQSSFVKKQILRSAKDAVNQSSINQDDVKGFEMRVPPLSLQRKFANAALRFERLYAQQREALRQAEHLFQTLLRRAFANDS